MSVPEGPLPDDLPLVYVASPPNASERRYPGLDRPRRFRAEFPGALTTDWHEFASGTTGLERVQNRYAEHLEVGHISRHDR